MVGPSDLTWPEVDPARHPFDPAAAPSVVNGLSPAASVPTRPAGRASDPVVLRWRDGARWAERMSDALVEQYGPWASGWRWSVGEGDLDGGPVRSWCCARDSMTDPSETLQVVAASLVEWRGWLEELAERFGRFLPMPDDADDEVLLDRWERAVAHLVTVVADRTAAESGWYGHCVQVLGWFLTAAGIPAERHDALIEHATGGRFESWIVPPTLVIDEIAARFAADVVGPPHA